MEIVNLKHHPEFLDQYITLRNNYCDLLLTHTVSSAETKQWLENEPVGTFIIVANKKVLGASILYLKKHGEVAIFIGQPKKGYGTMLLRQIEEFAKENKLQSIRAWTLKENLPAQKLFLKNNFLQKGTSSRTYNGETKEGIEFIKTLR